MLKDLRLELSLHASCKIMMMFMAMCVSFSLITNREINFLKVSYKAVFRT